MRQPSADSVDMLLFGATGCTGRFDVLPFDLSVPVLQTGMLRRDGQPLGLQFSAED